MLVLDFTRAEAWFTVRGEPGPPLIRLSHGQDPQWEAALYRFSTNDPKKKWRLAPDAHNQIGMNQEGRYEARSFPEGRLGNAFSMSFSLKKLKPDWRSLLLEVHAINQPMAFHILSEPVIRLNQDMNAQWTFGNLDRLPVIGFNGEAVATTRFDRLDTFEIG